MEKYKKIHEKWRRNENELKFWLSTEANSCAKDSRYVIALMHQNRKRQCNATGKNGIN